MKFEVNVILYSLILYLISCHHEKPKKSFIQTIPPSQTTPPFHGTIFLDPDIIRSSDPSTFINLSYVGTEERIMFDRRENDWVTLTPFLFNANYDDDLSIEIQINPEFQNTDEAKIQALKYAEVIGRLPTALRLDVNGPEVLFSFDLIRSKSSPERLTEIAMDSLGNQRQWKEVPEGASIWD